METVSAQEYQSVFSELQSLKEKFVSLEQENHRLLGDLQQTALEKQQQHGELTVRVQQLEATIISLQQQASCSQGIHREPKIGLPTKFDGTRAQFRGKEPPWGPIYNLSPTELEVLREYIDKNLNNLKPKPFHLNDCWYLKPNCLN